MPAPDAHNERGPNRAAAPAGVPHPYPGASNLEAMASAERYHRFLAAAVAAYADAGAPVLDFGAGTGLHARRLRGRGLTVWCVEPDPDLRGRLKADGFVVAAHPMEFRPTTFATVYTLNVLEHIEDDVGALRDLHAAMGTGGSLVVYVPAFEVLFSAMDRQVGHVRRYRRAGLTRAVEMAGFDVVRCEYVDSLGFFAALAYRWLGGGGELNATGVALYDRFVFPVSVALDRVTRRWFGKNLLLVARRG